MMADDLFPTQHTLEAQAARVGELLLQRQQTVALAESCTGGWAAQCLTAIAGSSAWFDRGFVTYSNQAKMEMLGVPEAVLASCGAVSESTAQAMAIGALAHSQADWSGAITGIAGPSGGCAEKPVGMVCFAWASKVGWLETGACRFNGSREQIRAQAVLFLLEKLAAKII